MRGRHEEQEVMLAYVNLEERVPKDHPLQTIKTVAGEALKRLSPEFDRMYSKVGRASVPPERLLKASLLISLYSVRSERAFLVCPRLRAPVGAHLETEPIPTGVVKSRYKGREDALGQLFRYSLAGLSWDQNEGGARGSVVACWSSMDRRVPPRGRV